MNIQVVEMDIKKILAIIFLTLATFPFYEVYFWSYFLGKRRIPKRPSGIYFLLYLAISILFLFIGLRLLLGPPKKKNK
jgi:hypothetical protein